MQRFKKVIAIIAMGLGIVGTVVAQNTFNSVKSEVNFIAGSTVEAKNIKSKFVIRISDSAIVALINIKDFVFPNSLMQEHFNENYMDSDKYPIASFSGKLIDFDESKISNRPKKYLAKGKMKIHGVEKKVLLPVSISKNTEKILFVASNFSVLLKDYKIKVPEIVFVRIAEEVQVKVNAVLE